MGKTQITLWIFVGVIFPIPYIPSEIVAYEGTQRLEFMKIDMTTNIFFVFITFLTFSMIGCQESLDIQVNGTVIFVDTQESIKGIPVNLYYGHITDRRIIAGTQTDSLGKYELSYTIEDYSSDVYCISGHLLYYVSIGLGAGYYQVDNMANYLQCNEKQQIIDIQVKMYPPHILF